MVEERRHHDVPLREYVERVFDEREKAHKAEVEAAERGLKAASSALSGRLETMNEFRQQIERERALYVRMRDLDPFENRMRKLEDRAANQDGRFWALGVVLAILTAALRYLVK